jgi:L-asparaginase
MTEDQKPVIKLVATGGTIANTRAGRIPVERVIEEIRERYPETVEVLDRVRLEVIDLIRVGSEVFTSREFLDIARTVHQAAQDPKVSGIIVTQGTFTTEETSYVLHLLVKTQKPIVITGASPRWLDSF